MISEPAQRRGARYTEHGKIIWTEQAIMHE
ncbi:hypothetical protein GA0115240_161242 [Streptomyces sp. DvalAA-14]|nr:hypothetical protein GA0115240_161242 [Streptomyces sp. DvalAA-14]